MEPSHRLAELRILISCLFKNDVPLSRLVAYIAEALDLGETVAGIRRLSDIPDVYLYGIETYKRRRSASHVAAILESLPPDATTDTVDIYFQMATGRKPIIVFVFGNEPWPIEDQIRSLVKPDERNAPISIHRVANIEEAQYHLAQVEQAYDTGYLYLFAFGNIDSETVTTLGLQPGPIEGG